MCKSSAYKKGKILCNYLDLGVWWTIADGGLSSISIGESGLWAITADHKVASTISSQNSAELS